MEKESKKINNKQTQDETTDKTLQEKGKVLKTQSIKVFITLIVSAIVGFIFGIATLIMAIITKRTTPSPAIILIIISIVFFCQAFSRENPKKLKLSDKDFYLYKQEQKQKKLQTKKTTNFFEDRKIKNVIIIDSYTEVSDKLHAFLNFQEIIQTRMVVFKIFFEDNTSTIVKEKEGSKLYTYLMGYLGQSEKEHNNKNYIEELKELKLLLDENIISKEEFENKKINILKKEQK